MAFGPELGMRGSGEWTHLPGSDAEGVGHGLGDAAVFKVLGNGLGHGGQAFVVSHGLRLI